MYISEGFEKFRKRVMDKTGRDIITQNIYLIQTEDMGGNITDEKYGVNLRTDLGMNDTDGGFIDIFLGTGTVQENYHDAKMGNINSTFTKRMSGGDGPYYPRYDPVTGIISTFGYVAYVTYDYNISGITNDITFTEIGTGEYGGGSYAGYSYNKLTTRTLIYDQLGNVSSITKHLNEKLTIKIYRSFSIHESVIENAYDRGLYFIINMNYDHFYRYGSTSPLESYGISFNGSRYEYNGQASVGTSKDTSYEDYDPGLNTSNYAKAVISGSSDNNIIENTSYYYDKIVTGVGAQVILARKILMNSPETITFDQTYTNYYDSTSFTDSMGHISKDISRMAGILPLTDFALTDSKMFNHKSGAWDIQDSFDSGRYSSNQWTFSNGSSTTVFYAIDPITQASSSYYIAVNMDDTVALSEIWVYDSGSVYYLADKYWDTSTWIPVQNSGQWIRDIPVEAQQCRYLVSKTKDPQRVCFYRQYEHYPMLTGLPQKAALENVPPHSYRTYAFIPIVSELYKWMLLEDHVIAMNNDGTIAYSHEVFGAPSGSVDPNWPNRYNQVDRLNVRAGFDNKLVIGSSSVDATEGTPRNIRIYDMTTMTSADAPSYIDVPITMSTYYDKCHFSKTTAGYVSVWSPGDTQLRTTVININDGSNVVLENTKWFHIQDFTKYAIYCVNNSNPIQFNVYNLETNTVTNTFTIADYNYSQLSSVCGCGNYFYMQFGTGNGHVVYMYDLQTNQAVILGGVSLYLFSETGGGSSEPVNLLTESFPVLYHKDCMVIRGSDGINRVILTSDPMNPFELITSESQSGYGNYRYTGFVAHIAENTIDSTHSQLVILDAFNCLTRYYYDQRTHVVLDLGLGCNMRGNLYNVYNHWPERVYQYNGYYETGGAALYNGNIYYFNGPDHSEVVPLNYALPHKITGQTYTYQQFNNPKNYNFAGKYSLTRTNHGNIVTTPSPPSTFTISGASDGSGTGMRFKSWWRWVTDSYGRILIRISNEPVTGGAEFATCLNKFFKVLPGNVITLTATLKSDVTHIDHLGFYILDCAENDTTKYHVHSLSAANGGSITIPTGTYASQYLCVYLGITAYDSSNNPVPIVATYIDTVSITVT